MSYCKHCGRQIDDNSKFCPGCGAKISADDDFLAQDNSEDRRQVFVGVIRKCPSCGAELPSTAAVCPQCGFELNTTKGSQAIETFSRELNSIEEKIASEGTKNIGWSSWGTWKRIGWVLLNIYTGCLPILIPFILKQIRILTIKPSPKLTAMEEHKAKTIENYIVPNEKGAIVESLRFIRAKVEALNKQSKNERLMYWLNLWAVKAGQIHSLAMGSLRGDSDVEQQYEGLSKIANSTNRSMRISAGIKLAVILIVLLMLIVPIFTRGSSSSDTESLNTQVENTEEAVPAVEKDERIANNYNEVELGGFVINLPEYYGENQAEGDSLIYYAETGEGTVMLTSSISKDVKDVDNETFLMENSALFDSFFEGLEGSSNSLTRSNKQNSFKTDSGLVGVMEDYVVTIEADGMEVVADGCTAFINSPDKESIITVSLAQSRNSQYNYFSGFAEILKGIKVK